MPKTFTKRNQFSDEILTATLYIKTALHVWTKEQRKERLINRQRMCTWCFIRVMP